MICVGFERVSSEGDYIQEGLATKD